MFHTPSGPLTSPRRRRLGVPRTLALALAALAMTAALGPVSPVGATPALAVDGDSRASTWSWPLSPKPRVTRPYALDNPYAAGHRGIDLEAAPGALVLAPAGGTVRFAGTVVDRPVLSIDHGDGVVSSFEPVDALVAQGDPVLAGQPVGTVSAEVSHAPAGGLHLGARLHDGYIDPMGLLAAIPRAVLLPTN